MHIYCMITHQPPTLFPTTYKHAHTRTHTQITGSQTHAQVLLTIQKSTEIGHGDMLMQRLCPLSWYNLFICCLQNAVWNIDGLSLVLMFHTITTVGARSLCDTASATQSVKSHWMDGYKEEAGDNKDVSHVFILAMHTYLNVYYIWT